jgi:hypothetical protein
MTHACFVSVWMKSSEAVNGLSSPWAVQNGTTSKETDEQYIEEEEPVQYIVRRYLQIVEETSAESINCTLCLVYFAGAKLVLDLVPKAELVCD